jgi:hypothetical protein
LKPGEVEPNPPKAAPKKKADDVPIPAKFKSPDSSGLNCTVDKPKVEYPVKLD